MIDELNTVLEKCKKDKSPSLDLGRFKLEEIPKEVFAFTWLEELCFGQYYDYSIASWKGKGQCKLKSIPKDITKLKSLRSLILAGSTFGHSKPDLEDFDVIWDLSNLEILVLDSTKISNINKIVQLSKLKYLGLNSTEIKDFSPISTLMNLETVLLGDNAIDSIGFLNQNIKLKHINLTSNNLKTLQGLKNKKDLQRICICNNGIDDISEIHDCKKIKHLCMGGCNKITTGKDLIEFPNLEEFSISGFATLKEIETNFKLKEITVQFINDSNITELNKFIDCEEMTLYGSFTKIDSLNKLEKLQRLYLRSSELLTLEGLELTELTALGITTGKLQDLKGVENWTSLKIIEISENTIESIENLRSLNSLETLSLNDTNISNLEPIVNQLEKKPNFFLELYNNKLPKELESYFEELENEGIIKYYKEKADNNR